MQDWIKGIIFLIIGNILSDIIPKWIAQYFLSLPNPLNSIGLFLQGLPSIQNFTISSTIKTLIAFAGYAFIAYAMFLFFKRFYRDRS